MIILLRNLNLEDGLCNGMRLFARSLGEYVIKAYIITGNTAGITVLIPRIDLSANILKIVCKTIAATTRKSA